MQRVKWTTMRKSRQSHESDTREILIALRINAQQVGDDGQRQRQREVGDEIHVAAPAGDDRVDELVAHRSHARRQELDDARREVATDHAANRVCSGASLVTKEEPISVARRFTPGVEENTAAV